MQGTYDSVLVLLSILTAVIASFVALDMASRVAAAASHPRRAALWLAAGALAMGTGIWAMHFVGMLAFSLPIPLAYDVRITLASWLVAVLSSALALHTVSRAVLGWPRLVTAGLVMGLGIATMHYLGMEALQMQPRIRYDPLLFTLSILFAVAAATAALLITFRLRHEEVISGLRKRLFSALVMGCAIVGMHYTGMAAAGFAADSICRAGQAGAAGIGGAWLGFTISGLAALFLLTTLLSSIYGAIPPTVRSRLVFLIVATVLPVSVMAVVTMLYGYQREHHQQVDNLIIRARTLAAAVDTEVASVEAGLLALSTSRMLSSGNIEAFEIQAEEAARHLDVGVITLQDMDGAVLASSRFSSSGERTKAHHGASVSISLPATNGAHSPAGQRILRAELKADYMQDLLRAQHVDTDWIVAIYDANGAIVARSHDYERFAGSSATPLLHKRAMEVNEDSLETSSLEGIPVLLAFSRSASTGWSTSISIPRTSLNAPLLASLAWLLAGLLTMLAASLLLAWKIGGTIANAVEALTDPALALGTGIAVTVPPLGLTEADKVGAALTQAARLLDAAQHEANHDALTGLANRLLFRQMVHQQLALAQRNRTGLAVLYVDLDGFKAINDTHGHAIGDALLRQAAMRLLRNVRACDLVARLGGDEFAVALINPGTAGAAMVAEKFVNSLSEPFRIEDLSLSISASVGVADHSPESVLTHTSGEVLIEQADAAMYEAKQSGKCRFVLAGGLATG
ncbi:MHYT domain-containing protein [Uliginosibacterium sp. H3]|uniref:MHYT domain-containing protein n=1 Tax=Uliginosibacterium silvisoli TaxID=3114758 RepID=A0ABU6JYU6_9RHOO|nr:MHYT domain-containing protein [Uliginosibacterium sp. H3]